MEPQRTENLDGWENAKAQFVLQSSCMVFDPLGSTSRDLQVLRAGEGFLFEYPVEWLVEIGLVRVVRGLTCVLALRWVGGLSPEEGWEACRVLDALQQRRGWFMRDAIRTL